MNSRPLLESSQKFLIEAIANYRESKVGFAVLHAVTAIELALKERLSRVNPALILKDIDAPGSRNTQTVALKTIPRRLLNLGIPLTPSEVALIDTFANWRNEIVHHVAGFDHKVAMQQLPQLMDTLAFFLRRELQTPIESFLPRELYDVVLGLLEDWRAVVLQASEAAAAEGSVLDEGCPDCGASKVLCPRDDQRVHCHLCHADRYRYQQCDRCGRQTVGRLASFDTGNWCDACLQDVGDQYIQMQIDIERGK